MEHRLSRIVTRSGDDGSTGLADGSRCPKSAPIIEALGEVDALNCQIGLLLCESLDPQQRALLQQIQQDLFDLGADLALPGSGLLGPLQLQRIEVWIESANAALPPLREFILPGGNRPAALAHVCRAEARRAERALVALQQADPARGVPDGQRYLNRLSDLLFVLSRQINAGQPEIQWEHRRDRNNPT